MSRGMKSTWVKGPRTVSATLRGKNKGPHVDQVVVQVYVPKAG